MSGISPPTTQITRPGCFCGDRHGQAVGMADTLHDARVGEDSSTAQTEDSRSPEAAATAVARLLANPRRIRRD